MNTTVRGSGPARAGLRRDLGRPPRVHAGHDRGRRHAVVAGMAGPAGPRPPPPPRRPTAVSVIVRELPNSGNRPERAVAAFGGTVTGALDIIHGFTAAVPVDRLDALRAVPGVQSVTEDAGLGSRAPTSRRRRPRPARSTRSPTR